MFVTDLLYIYIFFERQEVLLKNDKVTGNTLGPKHKGNLLIKQEFIPTMSS